MNEAKVEPKRCPFCGDEPQIVKTESLPLFEDDPTTLWTIRCTNMRCRAVVEIRGVETSKEAVELWNDRSRYFEDAYPD